jgi:hypothetical protein
MEKKSFDELLQMLQYIQDHKGEITSWGVESFGTWSEFEREIVIRVKIVDEKSITKR